MAIIVSSIGFSSCATLFSGTKQKVTITTEPSGACLFVDGIDNGVVTPATIKVPRKGRVSYILHKEGYEDGSVTQFARFNPLFWGNWITLGAISMPIDVATGAIYKYSKNVFVQLAETPKPEVPQPEEDMNFVPPDILEIASQEEAALKAVTEAIIQKNKDAGLITDNTEIQVSTEVLTDVDAEGNKILNYLLNYNYVVFANGEDFPPGGYDVTKSAAAMSLMAIVEQTLEGEDFTKYLTPGTRVKVAIIGSADSAPIRGKMAYDGRYGNFEREPYYQNGEFNSMTITKATGITTNPQLAYLRAASVKNYLETNVTTLQQTRNEYQFYIEVSEEEGGEFRRIEVQFTIIDTFK
jgi:hypothetical protein